MNLTEHFSLREVTRSQEAERSGIDNTPGAEAIENLRRVCEKLEIIRSAVRQIPGFEKAIIAPSSGYRSPALNARTPGSSSTSAHCLGQAVDFEVDGLSNLTLAQLVVDTLKDFDQVILEFHDPKVPNSGWVHLGVRPEGQNRKRVLTASRDATGKVVYKDGLPSGKSA